MPCQPPNIVFFLHFVFVKSINSTVFELDKNERVVHTSYNDDFENLKEGQTVEKRHYEGCPRFYSAAGKQEDPFEINSTEDPFDF